MSPQNHEALGLLEIDGVPRAARAHDAALKKAAVHIVAAAPVSPGKVVLILGGDVAAVEEALRAADDIAGSARLDRLLLYSVHPAVWAALVGARVPSGAAALGLVEVTTVAAAVKAADAAVKATGCALGRLHLATGYGGRAYFTLLGPQSDVEAAVEAAALAAGDKVRDHEVIAAPHDELEASLFVRPWALDPAR